MGMQMLKYHVGVPLAFFAVLMVVGVPVGTAVFIGAMAGCTSMMFMMMGGQKSSAGESQRDGGLGPREDRDDASRGSSH